MERVNFYTSSPNPITSFSYESPTRRCYYRIKYPDKVYPYISTYTEDFFECFSLYESSLLDAYPVVEFEYFKFDGDLESEPKPEGIDRNLLISIIAIFRLILIWLVLHIFFIALPNYKL